MRLLATLLSSLLAGVVAPGPGPTPVEGPTAVVRPTPTPIPVPEVVEPSPSEPSEQQVNLHITVPAAVDLGAGSSGGSLTRALGVVTVEDFRGPVNPNTWTVTVTSTAFVTGAGGPAQTIDASRVSYWSGPAVRSTGGGVLVPGQLTAAQAVTLGASRVAFRKTSGNGNNTVIWAPNVRIAIPATAVGGTYQGTITHSVA